MRQAIILLVILCICALWTIPLVWVLKSPNNPYATALLITTCILEAPIIFVLVFKGMWTPIARQHPVQPLADDAITRRFQSFSLGMINMGWSVHASVDDQHLHLKPVAFLRWFGAIPMSIRWEHLSKLNRSGKSAYMTGGHRLVGPAWCFEMLKARTTEGTG